MLTKDSKSSGIGRIKFGRYLIYASGEIVLVVIGILIALQINNWNQSKLEKTALSDYLTSISQNIESDIESLEYLRKLRTNNISRTPYINFTLMKAEELSRTDVLFGSESITAISNFEFFNAELSGFESIKSSGYLSKLRGKRIEKLIYKYYNLVKEVQVKEKDLNDILREAFSVFSRQGFENLIYVTYPDYIGDDEDLRNLQPFLKKILFHSSAQSLYNQSFQRSPQILIDYENLLLIGNEILQLIDCDCEQIEAIDERTQKGIFRIESGKGYQKVLTRGTWLSNICEQGYASSSNQLKINYKINELQIEVGDIDWGVVYYRNPSNAMIERPSKDFTEYSAIKLQLKGKNGGEIVHVAIKDSKDPDDGSETKVPITLSNKWEEYNISLSEFKTADLSDLFIVASLVFLDDHIQVSVREIDYVR